VSGAIFDFGSCSAKQRFAAQHELRIWDWPSDLGDITTSRYHHFTTSSPPLALLATPGVGGEHSGIRESTSHQVINQQVELGDIATSPDHHFTPSCGMLSGERLGHFAVAELVEGGGGDDDGADDDFLDGFVPAGLLAAHVEDGDEQGADE